MSKNNVCLKYIDKSGKNDIMKLSKCINAIFNRYDSYTEII